jgi:hypothetical protein
MLHKKILLNAGAYSINPARHGGFILTGVARVTPSFIKEKPV